MKIVAIKDMSAGNESVGEMWKETKIFEGNNTLSELMDWVGNKKNVVVTVAEETIQRLPTT